MASSSVTAFRSQTGTAMTALPSETRGGDQWTSIRKGIKEIWSSITFALTPGDRNAVKIFVLETSTENKRRFVGPTFHSPHEAHQFCVDNTLAWPGDQEPLSLDRVRSEGLLKSWSRVWSPEVEACVRTSAESAERFVENFNMTSSVHVRLPKTFVDQLIAQINKEDNALNNPKYTTLGRGYFFPDQPPDDSDGTDMPDTPMYRRVYAFASVVVNTPSLQATKYAFVRNRIKGDQYFVAVTPDFDYEDMDEMKAYFSDSLDPYPYFDFDAKWMLQHVLQI